MSRDLSPRPSVFPQGDKAEMPFGDPCGRCGAASTHDDARDRVCDCAPCAVCECATGSLCAYCGRSLGCREHHVSIDRHCETYCLASAEQRAAVDGETSVDKAGRFALYDALKAKVRRETPRPWPQPVPPWERR